MELQEFIKKALVDVKNGVDDANKDLGEENTVFVLESYVDGRKAAYITFDIAVTASNENSESGKGKLSVYMFGVEGNINNATTQQQTNRIQFQIAVINKQ